MNEALTCKFCSWTQRASGVYHAHNLSRIHLKLQHPEHFAVVEAQEKHIRLLQAELQNTYPKVSLTSSNL